METTADIWIAACAHALQRHWRTVTPEQLEEVAADLWRDVNFRDLKPADAAQEWLAPMTTSHMSIK